MAATPPEPTVWNDDWHAWIHDRWSWDPLDPRTVEDTLALWSHRHRYVVDPPWLLVEDDEHTSAAA